MAGGRKLSDELFMDKKNILMPNHFIDIENIEDFLIILRNITVNNGGFTKLSLKTKISREGLYKILNKKSNPQIKTLLIILKELKFSLYVKKEPIFLDDLFPKVILIPTTKEPVKDKKDKHGK